MTAHNEEKEAIEDAIARTAIYRGVSLCIPSVTRTGNWITHDDGSIAGPDYTVTCAPSKAVKTLIDALLDGPHDTMITNGSTDETPPMKFIIKQDIKAGEFISDNARVSFAASADGTSSVTLDLQTEPVAPVESQPTSPPAPDPAPPPPSDVAPAPLPPPPTVGVGTHPVRVSTVIDGAAWYADAAVSGNPQDAGQYKKLVDAQGNPHPGMRALFYADCVDVGSVNGRNGRDYHGSLTVTYDGSVVFDAATVDFWWKTLNQTIRYGTNQPTWQAVDPTLFPKYATPSSALPLVDLSKFDFSYNGLGWASTKSMADQAMRQEIAYVPKADVPFIVQPSDASYAVVRKVADQMGVWPIYALDDDTGKTFDITTYPNATLMSYSQSVFAGNPIAKFVGTANAPFGWDEAHHTGYGFVAAAATMSARDRFHGGVVANAALTALNPGYRQQTGIWGHYQERGTAWALRSLFLAVYLSDQPSYFAARMDEQRAQGERQVTHPLGFQGTYINRTFPDGSKGTAPWEENYTRLVIGVINKKLPAWGTLATRMAAWFGLMRQPQWQLSTLYTQALCDASNAPYTTWPDVLRHTLTGAWADTDIDALLQPGIPAAQVSALIRKKLPSWPGKDGDFSASYPTSCQDYGAIQMAAVASLIGAGPEWNTCQSTPTKPDWSQGWQWNIVP